MMSDCNPSAWLLFYYLSSARHLRLIRCTERWDDLFERVYCLIVHYRCKHINLPSLARAKYTIKMTTLVPKHTDTSDKQHELKHRLYMKVKHFL